MICLNRDNSCIRIFGGTPFGGSQYEVGGQLVLNGKDRSEQITGGQLVALRANAIKDGTHTAYDLQISKDGRLTFRGCDVIRSVNGALADANGNVSGIAQQGKNYVRYTNGLQICYFGGQITFKTQAAPLRNGYTWNFPIPFTKELFFQDVVITGGDVFFSASAQTYNWNGSQMNIECSNNILNIPVYVYLLAIGFWK